MASTGVEPTPITQWDSGSELRNVDGEGLQPMADRVSALFQRPQLTPAEQEERRIAYEESVAENRRRRIREIRQEYREHCGLSGKQLQSTFDTFQPNLSFELQMRAFKAAQAFVRHLPNPKAGMMLWGPTGRGKSHLAKAVTIAAIDRDTPVRAVYVDCLNLENMLAMAKREGESLREKLLRAELLVLDDIDKALAGDAHFEVIRFTKGLIAALEDHPIPVVGTTNGDLSTFKEVLSPPLFSRLELEFVWVQVDGINYREKLIEEREVPWWAD